MPTQPWDSNAPTRSLVVGSLNNEVRNFKRDIRERLDQGHDFPVGGGGTGKHKAGKALIKTSGLPDVSGDGQVGYDSSSDQLRANIQTTLGNSGHEFCVFGKSGKTATYTSVRTTDGSSLGLVIKTVHTYVLFCFSLLRPAILTLSFRYRYNRAASFPTHPYTLRVIRYDGTVILNEALSFIPGGAEYIVTKVLTCSPLGSVPEFYFGEIVLDITVPDYSVIVNDIVVSL